MGTFAVVNRFGFYLRIALLHLAITALMGFLLRLKMTIALPSINQKFLLNAHNHFAFIAWVSLAVMLFMAHHIYKEQEWPSRIRLFFTTYILNSWLMLAAFLWKGYGPVSMPFLLIHVILSVWFAVFWFRYHHKRTGSPGITFLHLGQIFHLISFIGPILLLYMAAANTGNLYDRQNAVYVFLHFQYNGYFLLSCFGLAVLYCLQQPAKKITSPAIFIYAVGILLAFSLIVLSRGKPLLVVASGYLSSIAMLAGFTGMLPMLWSLRKSALLQSGRTVKILVSLAFAGLLVKTVLQCLSAFPKIGYMVYEHRSIAIGYLHLIFLIITTFFLISLIFQFLKINITTRIGIAMAIVGVLGNELLLALQGLGAIIHQQVLWSYPALIWVVGLMAAGFCMVFASVCVVDNQSNKRAI